MANGNGSLLDVLSGGLGRVLDFAAEREFRKIEQRAALNQVARPGETVPVPASAPAPAPATMMPVWVWIAGGVGLVLVLVLLVRR